MARLLLLLGPTTRLLFTPPGFSQSQAYVLPLFLINFSDYCQTNYLNIYRTDQSISQSIKTLIDVDKPQRDKVHMLT